MNCAEAGSEGEAEEVGKGMRISQKPIPAWTACDIEMCRHFQSTVWQGVLSSPLRAVDSGLRACPDFASTLLVP